MDVTTDIRQMTSLVQGSDCEGVARMVNAGFDVNTELRSEQTALHLAVSGSRNEMVKLLLELGADPNPKFAATKWGGVDSPLHLAAIGQRNEVCKFLLAAGANPNATGLYGTTPLHRLLENITNHRHWVPMARMLLECGADPNAQANRFVLSQREIDFEKVFGDRYLQMPLAPLHWALFTSQMIDKNIRVAAQIGGYTGAHMIAALLEYGADPSLMPESPPRHYLTPLQLATKIGTGDDFQKLMDSNLANPEQKTVAGRSLRQLTGRPEIQIVLRADRTFKTVSDSIAEVNSSSTRKSKDFSPL